MDLLHIHRLLELSAEHNCLLRESNAHLQESNFLLRELVHLARKSTPIVITFKEITMLDATAGNTLVYTGTLTPAGSAFPVGTAFTVISNNPSVTASVDETGLVVTIPLPEGFSDDPANPLSITWETTDFAPEPSTSPKSLTATITPTVPTPPTPTPTGVSFAQTT